MIHKEFIVKKAQEKGVIRTSDFSDVFQLSRQYILQLISQLVQEGKLVKIGSTRSARYVDPNYLAQHPSLLSTRYHKTLSAKGLEEHKVLDEIEREFYPFRNLPENIKSIFVYAFSEMLNNAIEHSKSEKINVIVSIDHNQLSFTVDDFGIGVYRNIMSERHLHSEIEAIQDLLKGKTTTAPKLHSGEGIFFTSKAGDQFILDSYGYQLIVDNTIPDLFVTTPKGRMKSGTKVIFMINLKEKKHLNDLFRKYSDTMSDEGYGFDKTEIRVRLYTLGGVHISRSQARRVLSGLEKFKIVIMDYSDVPMIGQAFADEIYRVFNNKHPNIRIENEHMNEAVHFMIERSIHEAEK
ncbi:DUF4325 domain-containing protein [Candidatus Uhrbacteria bacterium]|nr:DUF4325 domain-containing protein [Candidatus Uhrbacteria bacterium]